MLLFPLPALAATVNINSCGNLNAASTEYVLQNDVSSTGTCFRILADNVIINGNGHKITHSITTPGYGVDNSGGYDAGTIKNVIIDSATSSGPSYAIYAKDMSAFNILDNTIVAASSSPSYGIYIEAGDSNNILRNNIDMSGNNLYGIYVMSGFSNTIQDNDIKLTGNAISGIYWGGGGPSADIRIVNNAIETTGTSPSGIYLASPGAANDVTGNDIKSTGTSCNGITVVSPDAVNTVSLNTIDFTGTSCYGIHMISAGAVGSIRDNIITGAGVSSSGIAFESPTGDMNSILRNSITTNGNGCYGLSLISSAKILDVKDNTITTYGNLSHGIRFKTSTGATLSGNLMDTSHAYAIYFEPSTIVSDYTHVIDTTNSERGKPIYYYYSKAGGAIADLNDIGQLIVAASNSVTIERIVINGRDGITLLDTTNSLVRDSQISTGAQNYVNGLLLHASSNSNTIDDNTFSTGGVYGHAVSLLSGTLNNIGTIGVPNTITTSGSFSAGVYVGNAVSSNTIDSNIISTSGESAYGISLDSSGSSNIINANTVTTTGDLGHGIRLKSTTGSQITGNMMDTANAYAVYFEPSTTVSDYNHVINTANTERGKPIYFYFSASAFTVPNLVDFGQLIFANSNNIVVDNVDIIGRDGITLALSTNVRIRNSDVSTGNQNYVKGIFMHSSSNINTVESSTVTTSGGYGEGVYLVSSGRMNVRNNSITTNGLTADAVHLVSSGLNTFDNNSIRTTGTGGTGSSGIYFQNSNSNNFLNNTILSGGSDNKGIYLLSSGSNNVSGGYIISPLYQAYYLRNAGLTNRFINTNFQNTRNIYFYDTSSLFNYNDDALGSVQLTTSVSSSDVRIRRVISRWYSNYLVWNDTTSKPITSTYSLTGLPPSANYFLATKSASGASTVLKTTTATGSTTFTMAMDGSNTEIALIFDASPPIITIISPSNVTYATGSIWFNVTLDEAGSWCGYSLDGIANVSMANSSGNWNRLVSVSDGSHRVKFSCNDTAGNMNQTGNVFFGVDTNSPKITVISPGNTTYNSNNLWFNVTLDEAGSWCRYSLDGGASVPLTNSSGNWNWLASVSDGSHKVKYACSDLAGNTNQSGDIFFTVDTVPPVITVISPSNTTYVTGNIWFNVTLNKAGSWCGYSLDGTANVSMTNSSGNWNRYVTVPDGNHALVYSCNDTAGNMNRTVPIYFTVDTTPPVVSVTHPPVVRSMSTVVFNVTCIDATTGCNYTTIVASPYSCTVNHLAGEKNCSITLTTECEAETYGYSVISADVAGNVNSFVSGQFSVKKGDGCPCMSFEECISGSCIGYELCAPSTPVGLDIVPAGREQINVPLGETEAITLRIENPIGIADTVKFKVYGYPAEIGLWAYFDGEKYGSLSQKTVNIGPNSVVFVPLNIYGGKAGVYKLNIGAVSSATQQWAYNRTSVHISFLEKEGVHSETPEITFFGVFAAIIIAAFVLEMQHN